VNLKTHLRAEGKGFFHQSFRPNYLFSPRRLKEEAERIAGKAEKMPKIVDTIIRKF